MLPGYEDREIEASLDARAAVPDDVFCYPLVVSWRDRIWRMLGDVITDGVRAEFARHPPEYIVSDDLSWLDGMISRATGQTVDMKELVATRLSREFRVFRAAHGTRTNDLARFYKVGLRRLQAEEVEDRGRKLFLSGQFEDATEQRLQAAIDELGARNTNGGRGGKLYFCADERSLITQMGSSGHYLVYGSEYLYCLGMRVVSAFEAKRTLKAIGRPTMFVCDIPMPLMQFHTLREFGGMVMEYLFCDLIDDPDCHALSPGAGSALSLIKDLPAEHIVGHYHPESVYDALSAQRSVIGFVGSRIASKLTRRRPSNGQRRSIVGIHFGDPFRRDQEIGVAPPIGDLLHAVDIAPRMSVGMVEDDDLKSVTESGMGAR